VFDQKRNLAIRRGLVAFSVATALSAMVVQITLAQTKGGAAPAPKAAPSTKAAPAAKGKGGRPANLGQLMKGIFYPNSNVIFAAQATNPNDIKPAKDSSTAPNPLESTYGKWEAVENSALALTEAADLLTLPGRRCANGNPVPTANADWPKFVQGLRDAGLTVYKAAQAKDQDKIVDAADVMTTACSNCHEKYREVKDRCK
jgi:cytochrome c556